MDMCQMVRSDEEIRRVEQWAVEGSEHSHYPGQSYEDGIIATLEWLRGDTDEDPTE
jgi:hypothetical protein